MFLPTPLPPPIRSTASKPSRPASAPSKTRTAGLADPNLWSNTASITNRGVNGYPNRFIKLLLTWQYASFGSPVLYALPDQTMIDHPMLRLRFQLSS